MQKQIAVDCCRTGVKQGCGREADIAWPQLASDQRGVVGHLWRGAASSSSPDPPLPVSSSAADTFLHGLLTPQAFVT